MSPSPLSDSFHAYVLRGFRPLMFNGKHGEKWTCYSGVSHLVATKPTVDQLLKYGRNGSNIEQRISSGS